MDDKHNEDPNEQKRISRREALYGTLGMLVGVVVLSGMWLRIDGNAKPLPALSEVTPYAAASFTLNDLSGCPRRLSDFKGKVLLLNFWATWCVPCKEETPALQAAYQDLKAEGLVIVGVNLFNQERSQGRGVEHVRDFATQFGVTYPIVLDDEGEVAQAYAIAPIPTSYFIDPQGQVRFIRVGKLTTSDVEQVFRRLKATD